MSGWLSKSFTMSSINFDVSLNPLNTWNCFSYGTQVWLLFSLSTELYAAHLLLLLDMSTTHSRENEIGRIDDTDTHTSVWRWYNQKESKKGKNQQQRPIYNWDPRQELWHLVCIREGFFDGWVLLPKNLLLHNGSIGPRLLSIRQKQLLGADIKEKRIFPNQSGRDDGSQAKRKRGRTTTRVSGKIVYSPGIFREKRSGFLFLFFVISSSLRASVCVCVLYTNIDPHTRPTLFCAPGFPCALLAVDVDRSYV